LNAAHEYLLKRGHLGRIIPLDGNVRFTHGIVDDDFAKEKVPRGGLARQNVWETQHRYILEKTHKKKIKHNRQKATSGANTVNYTSCANE
jgi:hypothetical protein